MALIQNESVYVGDWLLKDDGDEVGRYSRDNGVLLAGNNLSSGAVLGAVLAGGVTATPAAKSGGNTGDGTLATVTAYAPAYNGVYTVRITAAAANAGTFEVRSPGGVLLGTGTVAVEFSGGGLTFTVADGATDFIVGDGFDITVANAYTKYTEYDPAATSPAQHPAGILYLAVDATSVDTPCVVVAREAVIAPSFLHWKAGLTNAQKQATLDVLRTQTIIAVREA